MFCESPEDSYPKGSTIFAIGGYSTLVVFCIHYAAVKAIYENQTGGTR